MEGTDKEKEDIKDEYFKNALMSFDRDSPIFKYIHAKTFLVNNLSPTDPDFVEMRKEIKCFAENQEYWVQISIQFDGFIWNILLTNLEMMESN
ncbi:hypothetical protein DPMN_027079 [Dreissena polymorpha]|uniref:Uncharacterized protein n=1 Tax=Dreissena polymorpha TaxID=45954 RepID=A0A9D4LU34_DREPO|nr:hypothetical protein DPMN_027079 [Dreissena polymorpha]